MKEVTKAVYTIPKDARVVDANKFKECELYGLTETQNNILDSERDIEFLGPSSYFDYIKALQLKYVYSDPNPNRFVSSYHCIDASDCTICAIANLLDISYGESYKLLSDFARNYGIPINHYATVNKVLCDAGYENVFNARYYKNYDSCPFRVIDILKDQEWNTGKYYITTDFPSPHAFVYKNNVVYDIFKYPGSDYQYPFVIFGRVSSIYTEKDNAKEFYDYNKENIK